MERLKQELDIKGISYDEIVRSGTNYIYVLSNINIRVSLNDDRTYYIRDNGLIIEKCTYDELMSLIERRK